MQRKDPRGDLDEVLADFGRKVAPKLRSRRGSPEDHLRGPFEAMLAEAAARLGLSVTPIGEDQLPNLAVRPDYAVDVDGARVGYVELKRPGRGVPDTWQRPTRHDREQWDRLQLLPNVLCTDGQQFARYHFGENRTGVADTTPSLRSVDGRTEGRSGDRVLRPVDGAFSRVLRDFLLWEPEVPRTLGQLVQLVSRLCRLLRDDVAARLDREKSGAARQKTFSALYADWRHVLFPNLADDEFPDQYAQTVTFALLLARVEGVGFQGSSIGGIARDLRKKHSLMGRALGLLTDQPEQEHGLALTTMVRVLAAVDWGRFPQDAHALLYEQFLQTYDPQLRRRSGVYYTPASLVSFTTRFVDEVLRSRLQRPLGFASGDVVVVDPAMGTGSFLAEVVTTIAGTIGRREGPGSVGPHLREVSNRLIGFENQAAPYAVAELRLHELLRRRGSELPNRERRFLADTLDDPDEQPQLPFGSAYEVLSRTREGANLVKRTEPVMVVLGNPPYVSHAKGGAPWIERSSRGGANPGLDAFRTGAGTAEFALHNKYVYFWRWATWKAFDAHPQHPAGVVAFVCSAGFLAAPGFAGMREYLRRTADEGWIVDLTPEGHRPPANTRFFQGNQQLLCVAVFIRRGEPDREVPARVHRTDVRGTVEDKATALDGIGVDGPEWQECADGWTAPFRVPGSGAWSAMPTVDALLPWTASGVKPNRTWVYAPEPETLRERWNALVRAPREERPKLLKETTLTTMDTNRAPIPGMVAHSGTLAEETGECPEPRLIGHRAFDRKYVIPDRRVLHSPSPPLWRTHSEHQIYAVERHRSPNTAGPALVFSGLIPDMDHHSGCGGGRVLPLYRDEQAREPNVSPNLLELLAGQFGCAVTALDLLSYLAAVTAHPGYTRRYRAELRTPGVRVPLTRSAELWHGAVELGRSVLWRHTFGQRCVDADAGRPLGTAGMEEGRPRVLVSIPDTAEDFPETLDYDETTRTLHVGRGQVAPVPPEVVNYQVNDMRVVRHWFGYRRGTPAGKRQSPLNDITASRWTPATTTELLDLLTVLAGCVALEPRQDSLLAMIASSPLVSERDLRDAGVLPVSRSARSAPKPPSGGLFDPD